MASTASTNNVVAVDCHKSQQCVICRWSCRQSMILWTKIKETDILQSRVNLRYHWARLEDKKSKFGSHTKSTVIFSPGYVHSWQTANERSLCATTGVSNFIII